MKANTMRRMYLREAVVVLVVSRLAIRLLPRNLILAWAERYPKCIRRFSGHEIDWVCWAVETASAKRWIKAVCFPRALAVQAMLRRRGIASRLCLGVARKDLTLITHAWVEIGSEIIVGGAERDRFAKLAEFGGRERRREVPVV
jgi:hypothetical protein